MLNRLFNCFSLSQSTENTLSDSFHLNTDNEISKNVYPISSISDVIDHLNRNFKIWYLKNKLFVGGFYFFQFNSTARMDGREPVGLRDVVRRWID